MEYILIPKFVGNINEIHSNHIQNFLNEKSILDRKIPMNDLRNLYKENRELFFKLVDEFALRGFKFQINKPTNLLPNTNNIKTTKILNINEDKSAYKSIKFNYLGLSSIITKFQIDSDLFFNNIPIENFKTINASIDLDHLISEFEGAGFNISNIDSKDCSLEDSIEKYEVEKRYKVYRVFKNNEFNAFREYCTKNSLKYIDEVNKEDINKFKGIKGVGVKKVEAVVQKLKEYNVLLETEEQDSDKLLISKVFFSNSYNFFLEFCKSNDLKYIDELDSNVVLKFKNTKGVGPKKYRDVIDLLKTTNIGEPSKYIFKDILPFELEIQELTSDKTFLNFCKTNYILTLNQLKYSHLDSYGTLKGVGKTKVSRIKRDISKLKSLIEDFNFNIFSVGSYYEDLADNTVKEIYEILNLDYDTNNEYVDYLIKEIEGIDLRSISVKGNIDTLYKLTFRLSKINDKKSIAENSLNNLSEVELEILKYRFNDKKTLQEIGKIKDLSRERIRQIEKKALNKITNNLKRIHIVLIIKLVLGNKEFYQYDEMKEFLGAENSLFFNIITGNTNFIHYLKDYNIFFVDLRIKKRFEERIIQLVLDLPDFFKINEVESVFSNFLAEGEEFDYLKLLKNNGYKKYGQFYSKNLMTKSMMIETILKEDFTGPVSITDDDYNQINSIAKERYGFDFDQSLRAFDGLLRHSEKIVLVDKSTFQYTEIEKQNQVLIEKIKSYIIENLKTRNVINIEEVYLEFSEILNKEQIFSKYHLYSIIKMFYEDELSIGKGNTLNIYKNSDKRISAVETLVQTVKNSNNIANKNDLEKKLNWPRYKVDITMNKTDNLIPWGTNTVKYIGNILTSLELTELKKVLLELFEKGFTTSSLIYDTIIFNPKLNNLLKREGLNEHTKLRAIIKRYFPKINGQHFMYTDESKFKSIFEVLLDNFKDETDHHEIEGFLKDMGYKEVTILAYIKKIIEDKLFIEIDQKTYYPYHKLNISEKVISKMKAYIEENMGDREYISIRRLEGYRRNLPRVDHRWNPSLISSLLINNGFRKLNKKYDDYRNDMLVLVKDESSFYDFSDLAGYLIKNHYKGSMHESKVYDYLSNEGIIKRKEYGKHLPKSILEDSKWISVDELGIIKVR